MSADQFRSGRPWITFQSRYLSRSRYGHTLQLILLLLVSICLSSVGSLPLAAYTLPQDVKPDAITFPEGTCTATPDDLRYIPSGNTDDQNRATTLPPAWFAAGRTPQDFAYAQACGAMFVASYESFDTKYPKTLEAAVSMLSKAAKQAFYMGGPHASANIRMDPQWRTNQQQQQLAQIASVSLPALGTVQYADGELVLWLTVPYQLIISTAGGMSTKNALMRVQLQAIPPDPAMGGTGWNVVAWQE